jgi:hypothetical protein
MIAVGLAASLAACDSASKSPGPSTPTSTAAGSGTLGDGTSPGGDATSGGALDIAGVAVVVDRTTQLLPDGKAIGLSKIDGGAVGGGYQTHDGYLLRGYGNGVDTLSLWLVTPDGSLLKLVEKAEAPVAVAADGRQVAWRSAGKIYYGHIDPTSGVKVDKTGTAPTRGAPIGVGNDVVILGYSETGGGIDHHDTWIPSAGEYKPTWDKTTSVRAVYPLGRASHFYGLVAGPAGGKDLCVGELDPRDNLKAVRTACGVVSILDNHGTVSPDGHWLAIASADSAGKGQVAVLDLTTVFTSPAVAIRWSAGGVGAWEDASTMLVHAVDSTALLRYHLGSTTAEPVTRPGLSAEARTELILRLG